MCACCVLQNEMIFQDVIQLTLNEGPAEGPDGIKVPTSGVYCDGILQTIN